MAGIFLSVLKTAKVVLFFKKNSKLDYSNDHPMFLLSNIEELLENRMFKNFMPLSITVTLCITSPFGFRQYSIFHALINITENIRKILDDGVFVDLQKAFDIVNYQILLAKLNHYGVFYLSNRNQYVSINGYDSDLAGTSCDVPYGSVLGPLQF